MYTYVITKLTIYEERFFMCRYLKIFFIYYNLHYSFRNYIKLKKSEIYMSVSLKRHIHIMRLGM